MESKSRDILRAVCAEQRAKGAPTVEEIPADKTYALADIERVDEALEDFKRGAFGGMSALEGAIRVIVDDLLQAHDLPPRD